MRIKENTEKRLLNEIWSAMDREYVEQERKKQGGRGAELKIEEAKSDLTKATQCLLRYVYDRKQVH